MTPLPILLKVGRRPPETAGCRVAQACIMPPGTPNVSGGLNEARLLPSAQELPPAPRHCPGGRPRCGLKPRASFNQRWLCFCSGAGHEAELPLLVHLGGVGGVVGTAIPRREAHPQGRIPKGKSGVLWVGAGGSQGHSPKEGASGRPEGWIGVGRVTWAESKVWR